MEAPAVKMFYTAVPGQVRVYIPIYQGESAQADKNSLQGFITLQFPKPKPLGTPVEVRMSIGWDGILEVAAECDGQLSQSALKPGDWSTSLRAQVDKARPFKGGSDLIAEAERILNDWQNAVSDSVEELELTSRGRLILSRLLDLQWEWLLQGPVWFLMKVNGEIEERLPYVDVLDESVGTAVRAALADYQAFKAAGAGEDRHRVEQVVRGAIRAFLKDAMGMCLYLILVFAQADSEVPAFCDLAKDRDGLRVLLGNYRDEPAGGDRGRFLKETRDYLAAVIGRQYYQRALDLLHSSDGDELLSTKPVLNPDTATRSMRGAG